jgi:uncharacterized iron-regulated protein
MGQDESPFQSNIQGSQGNSGTACRFLESRRAFTATTLACLAAPGLVGCGVLARDPEPWEARLGGGTIALLGEVHDNAEHHRRREIILRRACDAGWRPVVVMEQFDIDRQADIDRARRERAVDAAHLIALAGAQRGWDWKYYEPLIAIVLQFDLPLLAGNLPRPVAARLVRETPQAVFGPKRAGELGLDAAPDAAWQAEQEREIDQGHCGALPRRLWAGMAQAQFARDAVMAELLCVHAASGAVLLAGNGHVRRDIGVPRWLSGVPAPTLLAVGFVESASAPLASETYAERFDAVVITAPARRADPCKDFKAPAERPPLTALR